MYFVSLNRNKKSIVINLKPKRARSSLQMPKKRIFRVENFKPGTTQKLKAIIRSSKRLIPASSTAPFRASVRTALIPAVRPMTRWYRP
jgi:hypothetical protein